MTYKTITEPAHTGKRENVAALVSVAAMIAALFAGSTALTPLYVIYREAFGFSQITLTLVYAIYVVGNLAALLLFGRISDVIGRRPTVLVAVMVTVASAALFLFAHNLAALEVARVLSGLGIGVGVGSGTAWLSELVVTEDKTYASMIATGTNFAGLGIGALVAGLLAEYAPLPLRLPFIIYLAALGVVAVSIWRTRETVRKPGRLADVSFRPRLGLPPEVRAHFVAPAVTGFGAMALVGFFAALAPGVLAGDLHIASHAAAGALFFELALVAALTIVLTARLASRNAMLMALSLMPPAVILLVAAQWSGSLGIMLMATALCGIAAALGYRGSLQVVNQIAPPARRAEIASVYFICCFCGNALPVVGIGMISTVAGATAASIGFACMITVFALAALGFGMKYRG
ncbi:MFS transporter [Mesorhizobium sp.]|jgi:MFS family permease|uniref:MFS transporter n=1 Tax=Mesorhizobium sp. TaxID=1871066 RepID=UPI002DDD22D8|nr:MFS transporter [Mesorhizobium sp.]